MVTDDSAKGLGAIEGEGLLINQLDTILAKPERSVVLVSPYFVPTKAGTDLFVAMAERGVRVHVLTNSLEATDVLPVHAGYAKRRKALLESGLQLYEMKRLSDVPERNKSAGPFGSFASSLHSAWIQSPTALVAAHRGVADSFAADRVAAMTCIMTDQVSTMNDDPIVNGSKAATESCETDCRRCHFAARCAGGWLWTARPTDAFVESWHSTQPRCQPARRSPNI